MKKKIAFYYCAKIYSKKKKKTIQALVFKKITRSFCIHLPDMGISYFVTIQTGAFSTHIKTEFHFFIERISLMINSFSSFHSFRNVMINIKCKRYLVNMRFQRFFLTQHFERIAVHFTLKGCHTSMHFHVFLSVHYERICFYFIIFTHTHNTERALSDML